MKIFQVIKWEQNNRELVHKFDESAISMGSQLVVYPAQTAFFVKGGVICDEFTSGTYTIKSDNIPLINKLINLPFGGQSPFQAEVWFVNQATQMDCKFGTPSPIQITDPVYNVIVPLRAYGQYGIRVADPRRLMEKLVGNLSSLSTNSLMDYFRGIVQSNLAAKITEQLYFNRWSVTTITPHITELSASLLASLKTLFNDYGIELTRFDVMSATPDANDPSFRKLKEIMERSADINILTPQNYQMIRSYDVLDKAAANRGNVVMGSAVGLGAGLAIGQHVGGMANNLINTNPAQPSINYYLALNGERRGPFGASKIEEYVRAGLISASTLGWKEGMQSWQALSVFPEFSHLFGGSTPSGSTSIPPIPTTI